MSRVRAELRGLRRRLAERSAESDIWDAVQLARHQERPYTLDYVSRLFDDFVELHGDRVSGEDPAIVAGLGASAGGRWPSWDTRRAATSRSARSATSAWRARRDTARRCASSASPTGWGCPS